MIISRLHRLIIIVSALAGTLFLCNLLPAQADLDLQCIQFTEDDGLYWNNVYDVLVDDLGYVWLLHKDAISRFDGQESIVFSSRAYGKFQLEGENYYSFFKDSEGTIWAGSNTGLYRINPVTFKTDTIDLPTDDRLYSFSKKSINHVSQINDSTLFVGREKSGYCLLNMRTLECKNFLPFKDQKESERLEHYPNSIGKVLPDPDRNNFFWAITAYGFMEIDISNEKYNYYKPDSLEFIVLRDAVLDDNGKIWASTWVHGICSLDIYSKEIQMYNCPSGDNYPQSCRNAASLIEYNDTTLLIAGSYGMYAFDKNTKEFSWLNARQLRGPLPNSPSSIYPDEEGNLWICDYNEGLFVVHKHLQNIKHVHVPGYNMEFGEFGDQLVYTNYYNELIFLDTEEDKIKKYNAPAIYDSLDRGLDDLEIDSKNNIWVLDQSGLFVFDSKSSSLKKNPFAHTVQKLADDGYYHGTAITQDDVLWLASQNKGVKSLDTKTGKLTSYNSESDPPMLRDYSLRHPFVDTKNRIWFAAIQGLSYFDTELDRFVNPEWPLKDQNGRVYFDKYVRLAENSKGHIYGVQKLDQVARIEVSEDSTYIIPCRLCDTLPRLNVFDITFDRKDNMWVSTGNGIVKIDSEFESYKYYGPSYGINYGRAIMQLRSDEILCTTDSGYIIFHPDSLPQSSPQPKVEITQFKVFDKSYEEEKNDREANLSFRQNFFSFDYHALDYISKKQKQYQYKLEGLSDDWINADNRRHASYTNLDGGQYTFKVRAKREFENWSSYSDSMSVFISTPFYKTIWFFLLLLVFTLFVIYLIFKARERQIQQKSQLINAFNQQLAEVEMKALRAQMNPHFLFNSLNAIKYFVQKNEKEKAESYLSDFAGLIRLVLNNSAQKTIPLTDELSALELYIRIERMRFDEKFDYEIHVDKSLNPDAIKIPPLILQPYVENAIWHGLMHKTDGKGLLIITIDHQDEMIICTIEDNGIGRERANELKTKSAEKRKSMGMKITRSRMELNAQLTKSRYSVNIEDLKDQYGNGLGTRVVISISS